MAIEINQNKNSETKQELLDLKKDSKIEFAIKSLLALAVMVIGVAMIVFLGMLDMGTGFLLLGVLGMALNAYQFRHSLSLFSHAANSIPS